MHRHLTLLLVSYLLASASFAADPASADAKLRENLRATMLQLRTAETERANLQAAQAELEAKNTALTEQLDKLTKQAAASQTAADQALGEARKKIEERDREVGELRGGLEKWRIDHQKITQIALQKEAQRAKLNGEVLSLQRKVADQQTRNAAMFKLGNEILERYEKFGLGDALTAREPFTGLTRVKFQNLLQDYADQLEDQRLKSAPAGGKPSGSTPKPGPPSPPENKTKS